MMASMSSWTSTIILSGTPEEAELIQATARCLLVCLSPLVFSLLYFVLPSPYGKLATPKWNKFLGPSIPARWAWFVFESPNLLWAGATAWKHFQQQQHRLQDKGGETLCTSNYILFAFFVVHYLRRAVLYPLQLSPRASPTPLAVMLSAMAYTVVNGYIQCQSLLQFHRFPNEWAVHPSFVGGLIIATSGMILNIQSDATLRRLKSQGKGYVIPRGGLLFDHVSCPHFLGEIVQWIGFAAACQTSTVAASFAAFTCANLIPRAAQQHAWYKQHFAETYPSHRKAWLPCVW